ncbi:septum formation initiator family protein [Patescibacteria group bacterium]|nr:septum formation initiator family protein [Patescibacteria group bacterium]
MPRKKESSLKSIISSKILFYVLILFIFILMLSLIREVNTKIYLKKELSRIQSQVESLTAKNTNYLEEIEKSKTEYFKEKQARLKMGLKKPGEDVIVIVPVEDDVDEQNKGFFEKQASNIKIWWNLFFKPN